MGELRHERLVDRRGGRADGQRSVPGAQQADGEASVGIGELDVQDERGELVPGAGDHVGLE
jgi:hypothetical protein